MTATDPRPVIITASRPIAGAGYTGKVVRVLSNKPIRTETLMSCAHRHRYVRTARECIAREWAHR